jgi:hypothetical protein
MEERVATSLTPEEQAQVMSLQERLIDLLVDCRSAVAAGNRLRAEVLQGEIDDLMRQRADIKMWASAAGN